MKRPKHLPMITDRATICRLLQRVQLDPHSMCWVWQGYKTSDNYGKISIAGKMQLTHRVSYAIFNGEIPEGMTVNHKCLNRSCCRHDHLELMTQSENTKEALRRRYA